VLGAKFGPGEAQILANLPGVLVKALGNVLVAAQARLFRNLIKSCGDSSVIR